MVGCAERKWLPSSPAVRAWPRARAWIIERRVPSASAWNVRSSEMTDCIATRLYMRGGASASCRLRLAALADCAAKAHFSQRRRHFVAMMRRERRRVATGIKAESDRQRLDVVPEDAARRQERGHTPL